MMLSSTETLLSKDKFIHSFTFRGSVQYYKIHMDMEIVIFT